MIGQTISHYTILDKLGEGGMGVVYKAEDTKLRRTVALKFLPPHLAASTQDKARFVQEAQAASALNHPNVCTIHDIQEHDGTMFIVMEYVEGQTLQSQKHSLSLKQSLDIGIQVADGLAAAHEKGIVHRDIKPDNIMIRKDGIAQIMDFGLAKLRATGSTINRLTREGSTVGTAGYMSPEQVQGRDTDHRSDIFSFGVLLYELFTGQVPFRGVHETALMYEIVNVDAAPMAALRPEIDPNLDVIVLDCLEKDPKERCQSVAEVARDLRRVKRESTRQRVSRVTASRPAYVPSATMPAMPSGTAPADAPKRSRLLPWMVSGICLVVAAAAIAFHFLAKPAPVEKVVTRSMILSPTNNIFNTTLGGHLAISPDGKMLAFVATDTVGVDHLWVRRISSTTAIPLPGTEDARYPFWSYDSRKIAFFARGKLKNVDAAGGPVLVICDAGDARGGSWNQNGVVIFSPGPSETLSKVSAAGGTPTRLTELDTTHHESSHRWPMFLPDGNHFIYSTLSAIGSATEADVVRIAAVDSSMNRILFAANSNVAFAGGRLLFIRQGTLMAQAFDTAKLEITADAVPIAEQMIYHAPYSRGAFSVSRNGVLVLQSGETQDQRVGIFDLAGNRTQLVPHLNPIGPRFSPDGKRLAFYAVEPQTRNGDIWVHELSRGASSRVTFGQGLDIVPVWSPHGDSIAFQSNRNGAFDLYVKSANGEGSEALLVQSGRNKGVTDWSKDGRYVIFQSGGDPKTKADIWLLPMTGDRKPVPFFQTEFSEGGGVFSPDSRWVAYVSDETGRSEIYARLLDGTGGKFQITTNGGRRPLWKSDGRKIYFSSMDRKFQVAYVTSGAASLTVDSVRAVFDFDSRNIYGNFVVDVSSDGRQVLANVTASKLTSTPVTLVVNWDEELSKQ